MSASNTTYEECFVAKGTKLYDREVSDDLGYIPIYNNRYVFISDQSSVSDNKNIIFYDLKDNKTLSTYLKVDAGYNNAKGEIEQATANDIIVFAFKPNSSYIVFKLNASGANPIIRNDKNASSVKYLGNNILAKYSDGTYHLFDIKGNEITKNLSDLKSEIVKYQSPNLLVKNNNKYQIYNADSGKVVSDEFDYIDLQSMYYVGIINKSMNLYNYSSKEKLLCQEISLDGVDSYDGIYSIKYNNPLNIEITVNLNPKRYYSFGGVEEFTINGEIVSCGDN